MRKIWLIGILGASLAASGAQCFGPLLPEKPRDATLRRFSSPEELRSFLADQAVAQVASPRQGGGLFGFFGTPMLGGGADIAPALAEQGDGAAGNAAADPSANAVPDGFSTTNIQESGVDESDKVKNDGQTIYVLDNNTIHIVQASPPGDITELTSVDVESRGDSLYLRGNTLMALSRQYHWISFADFDVSQNSDIVGGPWHDGPQTIVTFINASDPANPAIMTTLRFEGDLVSSRLIENKLHLIMATTPRLPVDRSPEALRAMTLDQWIPDYQMNESNGATSSGDVVGWQGFFRPGEACGYGITTIVTIDVDKPDAPFASTAISANAEVIYASTQALYISDTNYDFENFTSHEDTILHKLTFTEQGVDYAASGLVPGRPLNQYSLGEFEGYLRIATTVSSFGPDQGGVSNSVYVLGESAGTDDALPLLKVIGKIEGIAPGEQVYAARFIGNRGFVVTFRRVDPLFTMDLSDPANPKILGKLKVPGYSDHIQLMDKDHLLTIGKDAQDAGTFAWIQGVQLSIFDISDMEDPQLLHKEIIGGRGTHSEANDDPKAFNYFAPLNALAFPVDHYAGNTSGPELGDHEFTGLYVYRVTLAKGFEFLGRIATTSGADQHGCFWGYYGLTRGVFIDNTVYSATQTGVKAASLEDVSKIIGEAPFANHTGDVTGCFWDDPLIDLPFGEGLR